MGGMPQAQTAPNNGLATMQPPRPAGSPIDRRQQLENDPVKGQVDISVDIAGQVFLRGVAASNETAKEIEEAARSVPGVTSVFNQLEVIPRERQQTPRIRRHHRSLSRSRMVPLRPSSRRLRPRLLFLRVQIPRRQRSTFSP